MKNKFPLCIPEYSSMSSDFPYNLEITTIKDHYPRHLHTYVELCYIIEGEGYEYLNGQKHSLRPGKLTLVLPYQVHEYYNTGNDEIRIYNLCVGLELFFDNDEPGNLFNSILFNSSNSIPSYTFFENEDNILETFKTLDEEFSGDNLWRSIRFKVLLTDLLIKFDRKRKAGMNQMSYSSKLTNKSRVWDVIHYTYSNYQKELTLDILSRKFNLSTQHLSMSFKKLIGNSFHDFIIHLRISHATSLLSASDLSITEISYEVGFQSYVTFARVFKSITQLSPRDFRLKYRKGN